MTKEAENRSLWCIKAEGSHQANRNHLETSLELGSNPSLINHKSIMNQCQEAWLHNL